MEQRVRAVIVDDRKILLMHRIKEGKEYWVFPGGGLETHDQSLQDGLKRECLEELGVQVEVGKLFAQNNFNKLGNEQLESFYLCKIIDGIVGTGTGPEYTRDPALYGTYELQWVPILELNHKNVLPEVVRDKVLELYS